MITERERRRVRSPLITTSPLSPSVMFFSTARYGATIAVDISIYKRHTYIYIQFIKFRSFKLVLTAIHSYNVSVRAFQRHILRCKGRHNLTFCLSSFIRGEKNPSIHLPPLLLNASKAMSRLGAFSSNQGHPSLAPRIY